MTNLDYLAAKYGQQMGFAQGLEEKTVNTALSILHEQGIYALFLWLYQKPGERNTLGDAIQRLFRDNDSPVTLSGETCIWVPNDNEVALNNVREIFCSDLKVMFLCKDLISLMLTYARHAAKAR